MVITLSKSFGQKLKGRVEAYQMEVGILQDGPHRLPVDAPVGQKDSAISTYAGGPVRKRSRTNGPLTIAQVSEANRERTGTNYLTEPFAKESSDIIRFTRSFMMMAFGKSEKRRTENLLQAIVRNPILRGEYGSNSRMTQLIKGFSRSWIDTGQMFKAIRAIVYKKGGGR